MEQNERDCSMNNVQISALYDDDYGGLNPFPNYVISSYGLSAPSQFNFCTKQTPLYVKYHTSS